MLTKIFALGHRDSKSCQASIITVPDQLYHVVAADPLLAPPAYAAAIAPAAVAVTYVVLAVVVQVVADKLVAYTADNVGLVTA